MSVRRLPPGSTIGILGNGQLGRMTALAAARLGLRTHCFGPEKDSPAEQVCTRATIADYRDRKALAAFFKACDTVTYEFENIPVEGVAAVAKAGYAPLYPSAKVLATCQDRILEKSFLNRIGIATAPWTAVRTLRDLERGIAALGRPAVLKTARMGYDGKGQIRIGPRDDLAEAFAVLKGTEGILEGFVDFRSELSVVVARGNSGTACYVPVENRHKHHILDVTIAPAKLPAATRREAEEMALHIAGKLGLVGVLAVEMFRTRKGELLVNELAPRPHNSGHWTIDACPASQFDQLARAVAGLPLGDPSRHSDATMKNLIGDDVDAVPAILADRRAILHLYGKAEARPGRKMGHVTYLKKKSR
ncbi:MAG: 5-(carboxyamino)imidazole ribonucleotide synthase [Rhodospirillales bacterium]|nr:5-(carboxyamino)imidazole ribonucleotide synthase [Rhodospirillales bacterium]